MPAQSRISQVLLIRVRLNLPDDWTNVQISLEIGG